MEKKKIKVFEMFAGYGGASFGLKKAKIPYEVVGFSEIDKYAIQCWKQNHGEDVTNYGDCTKINPLELKDFDLLTGGFPCQSFSVGGKGLGDEDSRGQLFQEIIRIAELKKPKYMLLENVKGLLQKKHKDFFEFTKSELTRLGYKYDIRVYKSSDYGNPQKRERVFYVCQLNELSYEAITKIDTLNLFESELLELEVDDKYYLTEKAITRLQRGGFRNNCNTGWCMTQTATQYKKNWQTPIVADFRYDEGLRPRKDKYCPTVQAGTRMSISNGIIVTFDLDRYRYLTPKECFRLMGFHKDEINLKGLSDTQCYKLAGNGWDINLVSKIFKNMNLK